jgi:dTDP-4-dehydrorhamnose 3,5-epimerase
MSIIGVHWHPRKRHADKRGWLVELFRIDEIEGLMQSPVMAYVSETLPGIARGPHEHKFQTDYFCFFGPSDFKLYLWDNRLESPTYGSREIGIVGESNPMAIVVPYGVVHAYRNVGKVPGLVVNSLDQLYGGWDREEPVDEIRHEDDPTTRFILD